MLPNFIIVGAQKSGSTFLQNVLSQHPKIHMPLDEITFFETHAYKNMKIEDLEGLFKGIDKNKIIGIRRPYYLACKECAARINKHIPDVRLIVILRNPIDRAVSAYFHYMKMGLLPIRDPNKGLKDIIENKHSLKYPKSKTILENGLYYKHLNNYLKLFKREQVLILTLDEVKKHPSKVTKILYKFLGVRSDFIPKKPRLIPQKGLYSLTALKIRSLAFPLFYRYGKVRRGTVPKNNKALKYPSYFIFLMAELTSRFLSDDRKYIQKDTLDSLAQYYEVDNKKLTKLTKQKDIKTWLYKSTNEK